MEEGVAKRIENKFDLLCLVLHGGTLVTVQRETQIAKKNNLERGANCPLFWQRIAKMGGIVDQRSARLNSEPCTSPSALILDILYWLLYFAAIVGVRIASGILLH